MSGERKFGEYIRQQRLKRGWSVRQAARAYELSHGRVTELEKGISRSTEHPTRPTREVVRRIALALGEPSDYLFELAGYAREHQELPSDAVRVVDLYLGLDQNQKALAMRLLEAISPYTTRPFPASDG